VSWKSFLTGVSAGGSFDATFIQIELGQFAPVDANPVPDVCRYKGLRVRDTNDTSNEIFVPGHVLPQPLAQVNASTRGVAQSNVAVGVLLPGKVTSIQIKLESADVGAALAVIRVRATAWSGKSVHARSGYRGAGSWARMALGGQGITADVEGPEWTPEFGEPGSPFLYTSPSDVLKQLILDEGVVANEGKLDAVSFAAIKTEDEAVTPPRFWSGYVRPVPPETKGAFVSRVARMAGLMVEFGDEVRLRRLKSRAEALADTPVTTVDQTWWARTEPPAIQRKTVTERHPAVQVLYGYDAVDGVYMGSAVCNTGISDGQMKDLAAPLIPTETFAKWLADLLGSWHYGVPRVLWLPYMIDDTLLEVGDVVYAKWELEHETGDQQYHWGLDGTVRFRVETPPLLIPGVKASQPLKARQRLIEVLPD